MNAVRLFRYLMLVCLVVTLAAAGILLARPLVEIEFNIQPLQTFSGDWTGYRQFVGDVNGDGRSDLIWNRTNNGTHNYTFVGLAGEDGSFVQGPLSSFMGDWTSYRTYSGDFNGDGRIDLLWNSKCQGSGCSGSANYAAIGLSNGDGTFALLPTQQLGSSGWSTYRTRVADVDGDGRDDVIFNHVGDGGQGANYIYVAISGPNAILTLGPLQIVGLTGWQFYNVTTGDVNGDGRADLIWMTQCIQRYFLSGEACWVGQNNRVAVGLKEPGGFSVYPPQSIGVDGSWINYGIYEGNVDGDGRQDFVWMKATGEDTLEAFVGRSTDSGAIEVGEKQTGAITTYSSSFSLIDVDGDEKDELIANTICQGRNPNTSACNAGRNLLTIGQFEPDGAIVFDPERELPATDLENLGLLVRHPKADYNGDGIDDLLWSSIGPYGISRTANIVLAGLTEPVTFAAYVPVSFGP